MNIAPAPLISLSNGVEMPRLGLGTWPMNDAEAAAALAHGMTLPEAIREAQEFTQQALRYAYRPGMGLALPDRFFWARGKGAADE